jgi:hypothetical protein
MKAIFLVASVPLAAVLLFFLVKFVPLVIGQEMNMDYTKLHEDTSVFVNPERGWHVIVRSASHWSTRSLNRFRAYDNIGLILLEVDLSGYRYGPLDDDKLDEIRTALNDIRAASFSVIFRAAYDFEGEETPEPYEFDTVLGHINQLSDIFYENEDILYSIQAGFLGPWGEWHSSMYGTPISPETQIAVVDALLNAAPPSVTVAVRRPVYVRTINGGQTLTASAAFSGSLLSRVAYHNDALLSDESDMGTYSDRNYSRNQELEWTNNHTRYTPFVGETNQLSDYCVPKTAAPLLDQMNVQSLNSDYSPEVMDSWKASDYKGMNAYDYIGMNLGYRFVLKRVGFNKLITQGGRLYFDMEVENTGFGNLMKEKKFEIVLSNGSKTVRAVIDDDARFWDDDDGILKKRYVFSIPATMQTGEWTVSLSLSSAFSTLSDNPLYSVRFANEDVWDAETGLNKIGTISIEKSDNPGEFTKFEQIEVDAQ